MEKEMININANLIKEPTFGSFMKDDKEVQVANFTLAKGYGKGKEYINCAVYGDKSEVVKNFQKSDFIHIFGYFTERIKNDKTYKNFIVMSCNKIEKKEKKENEEE
ncbi:MAG: single-stranded DNA-binding protein [Lagierella massiliensis]|nr:single-stranded DNA-binding protein [Lagierella massiliensis]